MQQLITKGPTVDGSYPIESDLLKMTDDGCPLILPRLIDLLEERYSLPSLPPWLARTHYQRLREELELRGPWWAVGERMVQQSDSNIQLERSAM
jgi:hypothetical protein